MSPTKSTQVPTGRSRTITENKTAVDELNIAPALRNAKRGSPAVRRRTGSLRIGLPLLLMLLPYACCCAAAAVLLLLRRRLL